jgi:hypothetical protein
MLFISIAYIGLVKTILYALIFASLFGFVYYIIDKLYKSVQKERIKEYATKDFEDNNKLTLLEYFNAQGKAVGKLSAMVWGSNLMDYVYKYHYKYHVSRKYEPIAGIEVNSYPIWILNSYFVNEVQIFSHHL